MVLRNGAGKGRFTIEELAERAGSTPRNIRAYQTRGLVPPPVLEKHGGPWVGYYDETHLERLELVDRLRARGFSLQAIHDLLETWDAGRGIEDLLGFEGRITQPSVPGPPELVSRAALVADLPELDEQPATLERMEALRLLERQGDMVRLLQPAVVRSGVELHRNGIPIDVLLDGAEILREGAQAVLGRIAVEIRPRLVEPLIRAGLSPARLHGAVEVLGALPDAAAEAMRGIFAAVLREQLEAELDDDRATAPPAS